MSSHRTIRMSRRTLTRLGFAALVMPAINRSAFAQKKFVCKIAHTEGIGTPITNAFDAWAKTLNAKSGGRVDAQHFPAARDTCISRIYAHPQLRHSTLNGTSASLSWAAWVSEPP